MVICPDCGKKFKSPQGLAGHLRFRHHKAGTKRWVPKPGSHLITEAEFAQVFMNALNSNLEVQESLRGYIDFNVDALKSLAELNHQQGDDHDKAITELYEKQVELVHIMQAADNQLAELKATMEEHTATMTDLTEVINDLVARKYGTEEART